MTWTKMEKAQDRVMCMHGEVFSAACGYVPRKLEGKEEK